MSHLTVRCNSRIKSHFDYPSGKPMAPHLLRCQWIRVGHYTLNIGRLEAGAPSTFAQFGYKLQSGTDTEIA